MGEFLRALLSPFRGAAGCYLIVFLFFAAIFLIGLALGFDPGEIDAWVDAQAGWASTVGTWLFRLVCGFVLLLCLFVIGYGLAARFAPDGWGMNDPPGWGAMLVAALVGYFAWFGTVY